MSDERDNENRAYTYNESSGCIVVAESGIQAMGDLGTQPDCFLHGGDRGRDALDYCHQEARVGSQVPHSNRVDSQPLKWFGCFPYASFYTYYQ